MVKFNENGEMINAETGQIIGTSVNGKIYLNSDNAPVRTLQEMGVLQPQIPDDEELQEIRKRQSQNRFQEKQKQDIIQFKPEENKKQESPKIQKKSEINYNNLRKNKSKYQIDKDTSFIVKFGLLYKEEQGYFITIKDQSVADFPKAQHHWVKFRMWTYQEQIKWKNQSNEYNNSIKSLFLNFNKLNELKIINLILDWSFGEYDSSLKLLHCDGKLSDESYSMFKGLYPVIANTIIDLMNNVLENNI